MPFPCFADCVQLEKAVTASRYNLVQNGDFRYTTRWSQQDPYSDGTGRSSVTDGTAAPELSSNVYKVVGEPTERRMILQTIPVSGKAGDTFVVSGWAKGESVPLVTHESARSSFAVRATFRKTDGELDEKNQAVASFNPDMGNAWQYSAAVLVAKEDYTSITVTLAFNYNANSVCFDGIQLFKEEFGNSYTYDDDGNVIAVKDLQGQITQYEYTNNNLTKEILPSGAELTYTYDDYGNVKTAKSAEGVTYEFSYDDFGNNTSVSIVNGESKISSTATYSADGNR